MLLSAWSSYGFMKTATRHPDIPLAITMGCPAGIGPEIICRFFDGPHDSLKTPVIVLGDRATLQRAAVLTATALPIVTWSPGQPVDAGTIPVYQANVPSLADVRWGLPTLSTGRAMAAYIEQAVQLTQMGLCSGLVTCPISKTSLKQAGYAFPGHTEMLAALTQTSLVHMMMAGPRLKVVLVTIHVPLAQVSGQLSAAAICDCITMTGNSLRRDFGIAQPRIAVAGFNPHGGEDTLFGDEEVRIIKPAVSQSMDQWQVSGPWPPDTVFYKAAAGEYDAVIAMYHDQGLIPFKLLHFHDGVNVSLGLPLVRTSVDHGTAYDIAGRGLADPSSLRAAVAMAAAMVECRAQEVS